MADRDLSQPAPPKKSKGALPLQRAFFGTGDGTIRVRTYERGVENETLACGTGATAAAIVANFALQPRTVRYAVSVPGGELAVRFSHEPGTQTYTDIRLTGPARRVFGGVFDSENF